MMIHAPDTIRNSEVIIRFYAILVLYDRFLFKGINLSLFCINNAIVSNARNGKSETMCREFVPGRTGWKTSIVPAAEGHGDKLQSPPRSWPHTARLLST